MCGIAGIVTRDQSPPSEELLRRLSDAIAHRGPDGVGVWTAPGVGLVHRRLAIIDLSTNANQPMHDSSGVLSIVFNGEIYNYRELRAELEKLGATFRTSSDTEVILEGYRAWGKEIVKRLRGMFAIALWDGSRKELFVARDRIGKKPFFYTMTKEGHLVFTSEIKALATIVEMKPDWDAVRLFLGLQYVPSPRTGFVGIAQIPIGSCGVWNGTELKLETYHSYADVREGSSDGASENVRRLLDDAVRVRMMASDVPVGAFLSGGVDSAAVVAFASKYNEKLSTFTMGFSNAEMDERSEARAIAKQFGTDHHEFEAKPEDLIRLVDELIGHYDAPYADSSSLPLWLLAQQTAKQIKVVLTGDGGDELFGGYRRYAAYERAMQLAAIPILPRIAAPMSLWFGNMLGDVRFGKMASLVNAIRRNPQRAYGELFCGSYFATDRLADFFGKDFLTKTNEFDSVSFVASQIKDASLDSAMRFDLTSYLPDDLNVKMDRATMRFGLEARSPFLDQELATYALSLPTAMKIANGKKKIVLKAALKGMLPDEVLTRKKKGFQVPLAEWFRGPLAELLRERTCDPQGPLAQIVHVDAVERLIKENASGMDHGNRLWMLLSLSIWLSKYAK